MDVQQRGIITLIRSSLTGENLELPEEFDLEQAYPQIARHGVITMAYLGALHCGVDKKLPVMQKMFQGYFKLLLYGEGQMKMLECICSELDKRGLDHLLLKGSVLKALYPSPELRQMGDADILIRRDQYESIVPIMEALGFRNTAQGFYDYGWKAPELYVELHHCLSNPYNTDFNSYLGDGWSRAQKTSSGVSRYEYSPEDHFIYLFVHFTKHYRDGGIGIKHAADLWVYKKAYPNMDESYLEQELQEMGLYHFYTNVMRMTRVWFEDFEKDDVTDFLAQTIFDSGAFGASETIRKAVSLRAANKVGNAKNAKSWQLLKALFPNRIAMQPQYPILKKYPCVLPAFWVVRWINTVLFQRERIKIQQDYLKESTEDSIEEYRQALSYVGLNYTIKD